MFKRKSEKEKKKNEIRKNLENILNALEKERKIENHKKKILEISNEENKELLLENYIDKAKVFLTYSKENFSFPIEPWVNSFFENEEEK